MKGGVYRILTAQTGNRFTSTGVYIYGEVEWNIPEYGKNRFTLFPYLYIRK